MHSHMADEAVLIGPPPSAESYLRMDAIIAACKQTGADAVSKTVDAHIYQILEAECLQHKLNQ